MSWNQSNNQDRDPWSGRSKSQNPPDLGQAIRKFWDKFFTSRKMKGVKPPNFVSNNSGNINYLVVFIILLIIWFLTGIFIVDPAEKAVILRLGKYLETVGPGPHWLPSLFESKKIVNDQRIATYSYDAQMLTQDTNIVSVAIAVQYRINNARDYLFNVLDPEISLQQAAASALRQVIGRTRLDAVLTSGRELVREQIQEQLTKILSRYHVGLLITDVTLQPAKAPEEVKEAFDDAIKAQEDEQRFKNQAQAYAMQVEPIAKGQAQRLLADAQAYQQQVILKAKGDTAAYLALLSQYQRLPNVIWQRLYLDTVESVLNSSSKIIVEQSGGNNMLYLPLDKWLNLESKTRLESTIPLATAKVSAGAPLAIPNNRSEQAIYPTEGYL